jgi:thioredoxin-like negative regulator of GroEL
MMVRAALAAGALVVCLWFALGIRQTTGLGRAEAVLGTSSHPLDADQANRARSALDEAATLNPDREVQMNRALLLLDRGQRTAARSLARQVTDAEPQNLEAWVTLAQTATTDPALFLETVHRIKALEPRLP